MASPCEVLIATDDGREAARLTQHVADEAWRIEQKFSRYRNDNIMHAINTAGGRPVTVDDETAQLFDFADTCFHISDGGFDVTSGVLRRAWQFDGSDNVPTRQRVGQLRKLIGWQKVTWRKPVIRMPRDMEIDFGGIGKEYAVDRCAMLVMNESSANVLVNFGGDLRATGPHADGAPWVVGVERVHDAQLTPVLDVVRGAVATSGDARRFLLKDGVRYSHILDPRTGWPVRNVPRSVTVLDDTCVQAGLLATLAMLQGESAERFLEDQPNVKAYVLR